MNVRGKGARDKLLPLSPEYGGEGIIAPHVTLQSKIENGSAVVGVIGLGYVGLPLLAAFHRAGFPVLGFDIDPAKIASLKKGLAMNEGPLFRSLLGHVYGRSGDRANALQALAEITEIAVKRYVSPVDFALIHAGLGDADATFLWLEKAYETRAIRIGEITSLYFDSMRADPRYTPLRQRIGLPA